MAYVIPVVEHEPVVSQSPVNLINLTPIPGFFGSPHNLNEIAFDIASNNGSDSQVFSIEVVPVEVQVSQGSTQFVLQGDLVVVVVVDVVVVVVVIGIKISGHS